MTRAFIGVGSNIAPEQNIREALRQLASRAKMTAVSTFYQQPAIRRPNQPDFVNGVVAVETDLAGLELQREVLRQIEAKLGRRKSADRYAPRPIDLDLLLCHGDARAPHPDILNRAFVAVPLCELAPSLVLPGSGVPIREVAERFARDDMKPRHEYTRQLRKELLGGLT